MTDINPIKPLITISLWDTELPLVLLLFALFVFGFGLMYIHRQYTDRTTVPPSPVKPSITPKNILQRALAELELKRELILSMELHTLYLELTEIIKGCVTDIYKVPINNMTTQEIQTNKSLPHAIQIILVDFLRDIDQLKFSPHHSDQEKATEMYAVAKNVLHSIEKSVDIEDVPNNQTES